MKQIIQIFLLNFVLYTSSLFGQGTESTPRSVELGTIVFSYQENLVGTGWDSPIYVKKYVPLKSIGVFLKINMQQFSLRTSIEYFQYHNEYTLSELADIRDYDETVDGKYLRNTLFVGIEKQFLNRTLKPYLFSDFGFFYSRYYGSKSEFSGWTLETYYFDISAKGIGIQFEPGIGLNILINSWLGFNLESSLSFEKLLWKEDERYSLTGEDIKFNPVNRIGIIFKL